MFNPAVSSFRPSTFGVGMVPGIGLSTPGISALMSGATSMHFPAVRPYAAVAEKVYGFDLFQMPSIWKSAGRPGKRDLYDRDNPPGCHRYDYRHPGPGRAESGEIKQRPGVPDSEGPIWPQYDGDDRSDGTGPYFQD
jgi:hypothetical protein